MIIACEGADRSGKTTLLRPLATALQAKLITRLETSKETAKCWSYIEPVYLHLLECLYDPSITYVSDRSMTVSAQVYSAVFNRPCLIDPTPWYDRETIVYVDTPIGVLCERCRAENNDVFPEALYERTIAEYERVLRRYTVIRVDGTASIEANVNEVLRCLN